MNTYKENDTVIYTDSEGNRFDTFVIFDTDIETGLTHINHYNLKVEAASLALHPNSLLGNPMPLADPMSFILFNKLKEKYTQRDEQKPVTSLVVYRGDRDAASLAKAS